MKIHLKSLDRFFDTDLHLAVVENDFEFRGNERLIFASYVGLPEEVKAISSGFLEGYHLQLEGKQYSRFSSETYRRAERPIGLGDVVHGIVYHSHATIEGIEAKANVSEEDQQKSYLISFDGQVRHAIAEHVIARFGLPKEWYLEYGQMFLPLLKPLKVIRNPVYNTIWPKFNMYRLDASEREILTIVENALKYGQIKIPHSEIKGVFHPDMAVKDYMIKNADAMAFKLQQKKPRHTPDQPLNPVIGQMKRVPFPAQAHMIQAFSNTLQYESSFFNSADMGCGKSIISLGVANVLHHRRLAAGKEGTAVLLSAPGITLSKWRDKEIYSTLEGAKVTILHSTEDALRLLRKIRGGYKPSGLEFYLISIDRAKLGHDPYFGGVWKRVSGEKETYSWHCPDCGRPLMVKDDDKKSFRLSTWSDFAKGIEPTIGQLEEAREQLLLKKNGIPQDFNVAWKKKGRIEKCSYREDGYLPAGEECGCKLWRPALKSLGETRNSPRYNISRILKKTKKFFDLYIADEVHKSKAEGSGRGDAYGQLVKAAKRNLNLTGTLVNGKSSSIKEILWRTTPKDLIDQGFNHSTGQVQWARRYGKLKTIVTYEDYDKGIITRQKRVSSQPTEEAGIAPQLTAKYLLHKTGFLELADLGLPLVELNEKPIFIDMDEEHGIEYSFFHEALYDECRKRSSMGMQGAWSKFIPATLNYADRPDLGASVTFGSDISSTIYKAHAFEADYYHAKERKLVEIVEDNLAEGRGVVIYNNYTGQYGLNERTKKVLEDHGIYARILNDPDTNKRAEKLAQWEEEGVAVIIVNLALVEVGLDLLAWPTIIFNQMNYQVNMIRQASRRAWRIGQDRRCDVYYLVYNRTQQMKQFKHIMNARGHAMMVEGRIDKSELAHYSRDTQSALASDLASCFAESEVAEAWTKLAAKDLDGIEMISEKNFKQVIKIRMRALANETRRLCGLPPLPEEAIEVDQSVVDDLAKLRSPKNSPFATEQSLFDFDYYEITVVDSKKKKRRSSRVEAGQLAFNF